MKPISEVTAAVIDYGTFIGLSECLARACRKVYYYSPFEEEYRNLQSCCVGDGLEKVERLDEFMDPERIAGIDLFCFPDIGFTGLQRYLKSIGKAVWGSMGASDLELFRTRFLKRLGKLGLEVAPSTTIVGLTKLAEYLKEHEDCWVKINRYRANMETWHHQDYDHSLSELNRLHHEFGGLCEHVTFVVQEPICDAQEIGYDGICVDGQFPGQSFQGYEKKNELYLGSLLDNDKLPECVRAVNEAFAPELARYGYRNFWATEIRKTDDAFYFIDPTPRQAGQTMEHQYVTCANLPEVIWAGANGELIEQKFVAPFAAEATLHYTGAGGEGWRALRVPESLRERTVFYHYCECDGLHHFPPCTNDEVGVIIGMGDSVEAAIDDLKEHFEGLEDEPVEIRLDGFADLLDEIKEAQADGMKFTDGPLPKPEIALK